ncbi:MAG TPA: hypothetical protein VFU73_05855, partial [Actinocrinis sp.]|nr:hypothetical protein [Actinocrinis sp.]
MHGDPELRDSAQQTYTNLKQYFSESNNYWQLGNCFDTMTDYLLVAGPSFADPQLPRMVQRTFDDPATQAYAGWYDDYAWWAIASAKAYDARFAPIFGPYAAAFTGIAQACWSILDIGKGDGVHLGAPAAFTNRDNQTMFTDPPKIPDYFVAPRFDAGRGSGLHGVWQYDIFANRREAPNWYGPAEGNADSNPSWPPHFWLGPYQLTVVNALYLLAAVRFEQAHRDHRAVPSTAMQLADEYGFFKAWLGYDPARPIDGRSSLLEGFSEGYAVVRERVSTYAQRANGYPQVENWDAQTSWGGDQGMVINALAGYNRLHPGDAMPADVIRRLVSGYIKYMTNSTGEPQPYYPITGNKLERDEPDYKSGIGVFMRGLLQAYQTPGNPIVPLVPSPTFQSFLRDAVRWANAFKQQDLFDSLNVLATQTAAMAM